MEDSTLHWQENADLSGLNTFGLHARARWLVRARSEADVEAVSADARYQTLPHTWLGGGSNIVLAGDYPGVIAHMAIGGIRRVREDDTHVWIEAAAGESWHGLVQWTLAQGLSGLENLSLIPGTVGAAPVQNIGAYGTEVGEWIEQVRFWDERERCWQELTAQACGFGYRMSVFKGTLKGRAVITRVVFRLNKTFSPNIRYGDVAQVAQTLAGGAPLTAIAVSRAICHIRQSKLPNPAELGNAGSFFKNPVVSAEEAAQLRARYPAVPCYPQPDGSVKLAAGWLIEAAGLKGHRLGAAAVHDKQALVLVNRGGATFADVRDLAHLIQTRVEEQFGVRLESEPDWLGANAP